MDGIFQENNIQLVMRQDKSSIVHSLIMVVHLSNLADIQSNTLTIIVIKGQKHSLLKTSILNNSKA
jgi:hypothetical protein